MRRSRITAGRIATLVFLAGFAKAAAGAPVLLRAGKIEAASGTDVAVPVEVRNGREAAAFQMELLFDPSLLVPKGTQRGPLLAASALVESGAAGPGRLFVSVTSLDAIPGDGTLVTALFTVQAPPGAECGIGVENARAWRATDNGLLDVTAEDGSVRVRGGSPPVTMPATMSPAAPVGAAAAGTALMPAAIPASTTPASPAAGEAFSWLPFLRLIGGAFGVLVLIGIVLSIRNRLRPAPEEAKVKAPAAPTKAPAASSPSPPVSSPPPQPQPQPSPSPAAPPASVRAASPAPAPKRDAKPPVAVESATPKAVCLRILNGESAGHAVPLGGACVIGRSHEANLRLLDPLASRRHASVRPSPQGWVVQDEGSENGTRLNGLRLTEPRRLKVGDEITIGDTSFAFEAGGAEASPAPPKPPARPAPCARCGKARSPGDRFCGGCGGPLA